MFLVIDCFMCVMVFGVGVGGGVGGGFVVVNFLFIGSLINFK